MKIKDMLSAHSKEGRLQGKSELKVHVHVAEGFPEEVDSKKYLKGDAKRCKDRVNKLKSEIEDFIPEDAAEMVLNSLKKELAREEARLAGIKAQLNFD